MPPTSDVASALRAERVRPQAGRYTLLLVGLLCSVLCLLAACRKLAPAGVYAGDQLLYQAENTINTSYALIHTYVTWEKDNRVALARWPKIKESADVMRAKAETWFSTAHALRDAYVLAPTPENRAALVRALAVLHTALNEVTKYMALAANPEPN